MPETRVTLVRTLRTTEYFTLAFGAMVGVGWLIVIEDWLKRGGPGGAMLGFLLGGLALVPVAFVYGRFVREMPGAESELAYASAVFPGSVGFLTSWMMALAYLIVCPWEAVAIGKLVAYLVPAVQSIELYRIGRFPVYLPALILGLALTAIIVFLNYRGIRLSARFQNYTTFTLLALFAVFVVAGFANGSTENMKPFFAQSSSNSMLSAIISIILVLQIVPYFLTGFESVPKASEEAQDHFSSKGFATAIYLGLAVGVAFYVLIIGVVSGLTPWQILIGERYATVVAFDHAFHSPLLVRIIIIAALLSLLKVFNANFLAASRLIFALGRRGFIPKGMGKIHTIFQTPVNAILFCGAITVCGALMGDSLLIPVTEVGSLCSAFGWMITCLAFVKWKHGSSKGTGIGWLGAGVAFTFLLLKLIPAAPGSFRIREYVALGAWLGLGFFLRYRGKS